MTTIPQNSPATNPNFADALRYLPERGIRTETASEACIEVKDLGMSATIVFPQLRIDSDGEAYAPNTPHVYRQFPDNGRKFMNPDGVPAKPYILPKSRAVAKDPTVPVFVTEGPTRALLLSQNGFCAISTLGCWGLMKARTDDEKDNGAPFVLHPDLDEWALRGRIVYLAPDMDYTTNDDVFMAVVRQIVSLSAEGAIVTVLIWDAKKGKGLDDFIVHEAGLDLTKQTEELNKLVKRVVPAGAFLREAGIDMVIKELHGCAMSDARREQLIREWAPSLKVGVNTLRRGNGEDEETKELVKDIEPWPQGVDGLEIAGLQLAKVNHYTYAAKESLDALNLWIFHCDIAEKAHVLPILGISSLQRRSGKSYLMKVLSYLCRKALYSSGISRAAIYRVIELCMPTMLLDESDTWLPEDEEKRGILNDGHRPGGCRILCHADTNIPERLSTFCAKAISGIGDLPDTLEDRAVLIRLERKPEHIHVDDPYRADVEEFTNIARKRYRWMLDNLSRIQSARPERLCLGNDRASDNWEALQQIAEVLGGDWPQRIKDAAILLTPSEADNNSVVNQIMLALQRIAVEQKTDLVDGRVSSIAMVSYLNQDKQAPWADWNKGNGITVHKLGRIMKGCTVNNQPLKSEQVMVNKKRCRGYAWSDLQNVFEQVFGHDFSEYPEKSVHSCTSNVSASASTTKTIHSPAKNPCTAQVEPCTIQVEPCTDCTTAQIDPCTARIEKESMHDLSGSASITYEDNAQMHGSFGVCGEAKSEQAGLDILTAIIRPDVPTPTPRPVSENFDQEFDKAFKEVA